MHRTFVDRYHTLTKVFKGDFRRLPRVTIFTIVSISIYNFGWGFADPFFSLYLSEFSDQYTVIGFYSTLATIAGVVILIPLGDLLDRVRHNTVINFAKIGYFFVGLGYFLAGVYSSVPILIFALLLNGLLGVMVWTGTTATLRDFSEKHDAALTFGFYFAASKLAWSLGLGICLWLVWNFPIYYIFIPVMFFPVFSTIFSRKQPDSHTEPVRQACIDIIKKDKFIMRLVREMKDFNAEMWWMYILRFLSMAIHVLGFVFIPLYVQELGYSIFMIGILVIIISTPFLLSFISAEIADHSERLRNIIIGFGISAIGIACMSIWHHSFWQVVILSFIFIAGLAFLLPSLSSVISVLTPKKYSGTGSAMSTLVQALGAVIFAPILGLAVDQFGWSLLFIGSGVMCTLFMLITVVLQIKVKRKNLLFHMNHPRAKQEPYIA